MMERYRVKKCARCMLGSKNSTRPEVWHTGDVQTTGSLPIERTGKKDGVESSTEDTLMDTVSDIMFGNDFLAEEEAFIPT